MAPLNNWEECPACGYFHPKTLQCQAKADRLLSVSVIVPREQYEALKAELAATPDPWTLPLKQFLADPYFKMLGRGMRRKIRKDWQRRHGITHRQARGWRRPMRAKKKKPAVGSRVTHDLAGVVQALVGGTR